MIGVKAEGADAQMAPGLLAAVQRNCDLADARYAQLAPLCTYLLQMREHFRWRSGLALDAPPDRREVGRFIATHEAYWQTLDEAGDDVEPGLGGFSVLPPGDDPFDVDAVNARIAPGGLHYGAGVVRLGRPDFFVAQRVREERRGRLRVVVTGAERARGVNPPVAFSRRDVAVVRMDAMRRWLWTRIELLDRRAGETALSRALGPVGAGGLVAALDRIVEREVETMILHEVGEHTVGDVLGDGWQQMVASLGDARTESLVRAVRDLAADCTTTLPALIARDADASVHFWFSTLEGLRRALAPGLWQGYEAWARGDRRALRTALDADGTQWLGRAQSYLEAWQRGGADAVRALAADAIAAALD